MLGNFGNRVEPFALEHSKAGYWADFAAYAVAIVLLASGLALYGPRSLWSLLIGIAVFGLASWSLIEYGMHRFVLHGLEPFRSWHGAHHERPHALISAPTLLSAGLIGGLVFLPALLALGAWQAAALTLGVTTGYLAYAITHHAAHHWQIDSAWLKERKRWHARHHHAVGGCCYGVSSSFWDRVFGSAGARRPG
jgi:sterol desaturase/sphingolipid hydroxylase (fatty acid hydroxylase superfamily)